MTIALPSQIKGKTALQFVSDLSKISPDNDGLEIDFAELRRITPLGLTALMSHLNLWRNTGAAVRFSNLESCAILGYLQRMDLFACAGISLPESFKRRESKGKFVPVQEIGHQVEKMGDEVAACLAPGGDDYGHRLCDLYDLVWYVITEIGNNVRQHSCGTGYACAQITAGDGMVKIAMADNGMGILKSLQNVELKGSEDFTHADAILKAMEPRVSSKGTPTNEGVGLTLVAELAELLESWLLVMSGDAVITMKRGESPEIQKLPDKGHVSGTIIGLSVEQSKVLDFSDLLTRAKVRKGLLPEDYHSGRFTS